MTIPQPPASPDPASARPVEPDAAVAARPDQATEHAEPAIPPAPPIDEGEWRRVSPKYTVVELIGWAIYLVIIAAAAVAMYLFGDLTWQWWPAGGVLLLIGIAMAVTPRRVRSIVYQLREDDLLFRRGIMWQRTVAVPYGRMQLVDINRGPLARAFKLAELKFVTASPTTNVVIPGLPEEEVEQLRDHLVAVAESRRTGL